MIRIGILGGANIAIRSVLPVLVKHPDFRIAAIASRSAEKATQLARQYDCRPMSYSELVESPDVDALYVPLPTGLHFEWCMAALRQGKHVLCEKSLGCTLAEVDAIVRQAKAGNLALMETFQFRFHRQNRWVKQFVMEGGVGEVRCFRSSFGFPPFADPDNIRYQPELGGGALLDAGAYTLKALDFFLGGDFEVRAATLTVPDGRRVECSGGAYLSDSRGRIAELAFGFDHFYQCNYEIWGDRAKISVQRAFTAPANFKPDVLVERQEGVERIELEPDDHFFNMFTEFAGMVANPRVGLSYAECRRQAALIEQLRRAAGPPMGTANYEVRSFAGGLMAESECNNAK